MRFPKPKDHLQRQKAAIPAGQNIIVEAGAGTGKTHLLTDRLCYLILGLDIPIDKIIALTFTEKAAAEIKIRLLLKMQALLAQLDKKDTEDEIIETLLKQFKKKKPGLRQSIQKAFETAERAQISTIHSFCLRILRRYPLEAGLAPQTAVDDGSALQNIFDKAWSVFLETELAQNAPRAPQWQQLLEAVSLEEVKDFVQTLLTPGLKDYHPYKNFDFFKTRCADFAARLKEISLPYPPTRNKTMEPALEAAQGLLAEAADFFETLKLKPSGFDIAKPPTQPNNWSDDDYQETLEIIAFAASVKPQNQAIIYQAFTLLSPFIKETQKRLRAENLVTYDGLIESARLLLKNNKYVRNELKKEYRSILIDEFQDTDPAQGEILLYLAEEENSCAAKWQDIKLESGKLFTVGDPKQSIYRFRGADITAYEKFTDLMARQNALKCMLQVNFRSSDKIIAFANAYGEKAIQAARGVQPPFAAIENGKDFVAPPVCIAAIEGGDDAGNIEAYRHNQAQFIAAWIRDHAHKTKNTEGKPLAYKDIAILLRSATALDIYTDALKRFDIKYTVEETKNFYNTQEVNDILNILTVIDNPQDKTALLAVLRSPFAPLKDEEILELSQNKQLDIFAQPKNPAAAAALKKLKELHLKAGRMSLESLLTQIIYESSFCALQTLATQREQTTANIFKFLAVARAAHGQGALSVGQFLSYAQNYSKEKQGEGESPLAEESLDTVRIMTMHKSKGLEFPVVFLADISKEEKNKHKPPQYRQNWELAMQGIRLGKLQDAAFAYMQMSARAHAIAEERRVLYVALTRAKERLIIAGDLGEEKNTLAATLRSANCWPDAQLKPQTLLHGAAQADVHYIPYRDPQDFTDTFHAAQAQEEKLFDIKAWLETWQQRNAIYEAAKTRSAAPSDAGKEAPAESKPPAQKDAAAITGTLCHAMVFELFTGKETPVAQLAMQLGFDPALFAPQLEEAQKITAAFVQSPLYKKLKALPLAAAEMPFTFIDENGRAVSGIIDAVFKTPGGLFIADYKSDNIDISAAKERAAQYKPQLDIYKAALKQIAKDTEIEAAVIFLRNALEVKI